MKQIDKSIEEYERSTDDSKHGEQSVLQKLLKIDRHYAIVMTFDMLLAGIDTVYEQKLYSFLIKSKAAFDLQTSASVVNLLYLLAKNPEKQEKLRTEIINLLPNIDSEITQETLNHAPYFRGSLKESMRLQPINSGNIRGAGKDTVLNGYQIPENVNPLSLNEAGLCLSLI